MIGTTIVDTGPIVAYLSHDDANHQWAVAAFGAVAAPLLTCEAVITEACFLIRRRFKSADGVMNLLERGGIKLQFSLASERDRVRSLIKRYADTPMSLADACLVRMTETYPEAKVMTLDSDFAVYRRHGRQAIPLIAPYV